MEKQTKIIKEPTKQTKKRQKFQEEILPNIKIYGYSKIEDLIISALVTGEPILLIGSHGTAKTMLARSIARTLGLKFIAYDASKALFEDVLGLPNPESLKNGKLEYLSTDISIWDKEFILIDEVSRASPSMQNKWLEIIRSRQLMGKKIESLKYIFAAMNPATDSYVGTTTLDAAFAGRFAFIVKVPEATEMSREDIIKIINNISEDDAVGIKDFHLNNNVVSNELKEIVAEANKIIEKIDNNYSNIVANYVANISKNFEEHEVKLDGRRLGMIKRNIIAYLTVKILKHDEDYVKKNMNQIFYDCLNSSLPFPATGEDVKQEIIQFVHIKSFSEDGSSVSFAFYKDIHNQCQNTAKFIIESYDGLDYFYLHRLISKFLEITSLEKVKNSEELLDIYFAVKQLTKFLQQNANKIPLDIQTKIYTRYLRLTSIIASLLNYNMRGLSTILTSILSEDTRNFYKKPKMLVIDKEELDIPFRLLFNLSFTEKRSVSINYNTLEELKGFLSYKKEEK